jgi:hypothetical protein
MKLLFKSIVTLILPIVISCEVEFDPFGEWQDRYALTCILSSETEYQITVLTKGYRPGGYDPYSYTNDPSVFAADIRVWYNDSVFIFRDTTVVRENTSRYNTPFHYYYCNEFHININEPIEVEVLLTNGKRLRSASLTSRQINFDDDSDVLIPPVSSNIIQVFWDQQSEGTFFQPILSFNYLQNENGVIVEKNKVVPIKYVQKNGELVPVYPSASASPNVVYEMDAITRSLQEISEGDPQKQNYTIYQRLDFKVKAYDLPASRYVSSTSGSTDDLTVTVDVPDYTNVEGGLGIFGSYVSRTYDRLRFQQNYIESFGYNFIQR